LLVVVYKYGILYRACDHIISIFLYRQMMIFIRRTRAGRDVLRSRIYHLAQSSISPYIRIDVQARTMASATLNDERFLADRAVPLCSLDVAKSFAHLRCELYLWILNYKSRSSPAQSSGEEIYTFPEPRFLGWRPDHSRSGLMPYHYLFHKHLTNKLGQWTSQAVELYDLLILTLSNDDKSKLGNLDELRVTSGLSVEEWDDLLQYITQVCCESHHSLIGMAQAGYRF